MPAQYTCTVDATQVELNQQASLVSMVLTDAAGSFARTAFSVPDAMKRESLAIGLAAISTQSQVFAVLDSPNQVPRQCYLLSILAD